MISVCACLVEQGKKRKKKCGAKSKGPTTAVWPSSYYITLADASVAQSEGRKNEQLKSNIMGATITNS